MENHSKDNKDQPVNPENECAELYREFPCAGCRLKKMFTMQGALQTTLFADNPSGWPFPDKVRYVKDQWHSLTIEYGELMGGLPYKHWRDYTIDELAGYRDRKHRLEVLFEYVDMLHFFMNIGIGLGFTSEEIFSAYMSKNDENFRRQEDGYGKGDKATGEQRKSRI